MQLNPIFELCKENLEAQRAELTAAIEGLVDDLEGASIAVSLREDLLDVNDALARLEGGTYGVCKRCKGNVTNARLYEMPLARLCLDCAGSE